jgi:putative SOS response-associated peptidase YedK
MCGRFHLEPDEDFYPRFGLKHKDDDYIKPNDNVRPGTYIPVINNSPAKELSLMKWGFIPVWAKDEKIGYKMINSRSETIFEKPSFRSAIKNSRCLIPATGFYEWDDKKRPHLFQPKDDKYMAFAGIYSKWKNSNGEIIPTCSIITTSANKYVAKIHERMPVIIEKDKEDVWLEIDDLDFLQDIVHQQVKVSLTDQISKL